MQFLKRVLIAPVVLVLLTGCVIKHSRDRGVEDIGFLYSSSRKDGRVRIPARKIREMKLKVQAEAENKEEESRDGNTSKKRHPEGNVSFSDQGLERAVRDVLDRFSGPIQKQDVQEITELNAANHGIRSLEGLSKMENLEVLLLQNNQLNDLTPICALDHLRVLDLSGNNLKSLENLECDSRNAPNDTVYSSLREVNLTNNRLETAGVLNRFESLKSVHLAMNRIRNIHFYEGISGARFLNIAANPLRQSEIRKLQKQEEQQNFQFLHGMELNIQDPALENVIRKKIRKKEGPLLISDVIHVRSLSAPNKSIQSLSGLEALSSLRSLFLPGNNIRDIAPIYRLPRLRSINFSGNPVEVQKPIQGFGYVQK